MRCSTKQALEAAICTPATCPPYETKYTLTTTSRWVASSKARAHTFSASRTWRALPAESCLRDQGAGDELGIPVHFPPTTPGHRGGELCLRRSAAGADAVDGAVWSPTATCVDRRIMGAARFGHRPCQPARHLRTGSRCGSIWLESDIRSGAWSVRARHARGPHGPQGTGTRSAVMTRAGPGIAGLCRRGSVRQHREVPVVESGRRSG
jgi:hypothetical protein